MIKGSTTFRSLKMNDKRLKAISIERRYRVFHSAWTDILRELRAERGALLGSSEYDDQLAMQKAVSLDLIDQRIQDAETWMTRYQNEREDNYRKLKWNARKLINEIKTMTDNELEAGHHEI